MSCDISLLSLRGSCAPGSYIFQYSVTSSDGSTRAAVNRTIIVYQSAALTASFPLYQNFSDANAAKAKAATISSNSSPLLADAVAGVQAAMGVAGEQVEAGDVVLHEAQVAQAANGLFSVFVNATVYMYLPKGVHHNAVEQSILTTSAGVAGANATVAAAGGGLHRRGLLQDNYQDQPPSDDHASLGLPEGGIGTARIHGNEQESRSCPWPAAVVGGHCNSRAATAHASAAGAHEKGFPAPSADATPGAVVRLTRGQAKRWADALSEASAVTEQAEEVLALLSSGSRISQSSSNVERAEEPVIDQTGREFMEADGSVGVGGVGVWAAGRSGHRSILATSFADDLRAVQEAVKDAGATGVVLQTDGSAEVDVVEVSWQLRVCACSAWNTMVLCAPNDGFKTFCSSAAPWRSSAAARSTVC